MFSQPVDFAILGGGVIGLALALETRRRHPKSRILVLEKETGCGQHASGRNSGVLHAGFYYTADSLKARFTLEGNRQWTRYCLERHLPLRQCGKLVVARHAGELAGLDELKRRGDANGVPLHMITADEARRLEPRVKTWERALFSPETSSLDPSMAMASLELDVRNAGIDLATDTAFIGQEAGHILTSRGRLAAGYVINAAGLYADRIAKAYGFAQEYTMLPFKGLYLKGEPSAGPLALHIYPVPNLANPFLGVHFTVTVHGIIKIGPTAIPAFWREHYTGLERFRMAEMAAILGLQTDLFLRNSFGFRQLAFTELRKHYRPHLVALAGELLTSVQVADYPHWGPPGLRAQLFDLKKHALEMDFQFQGDDRSFHVLNAVSPGFTCAFPFANYLMDQVELLR